MWKIPETARKKWGKSRGVERKNTGKSFDGIPGGTISENEYPQQGGGYRLFLEKPNGVLFIPNIKFSFLSQSQKRQ